LNKVITSLQSLSKSDVFEFSVSTGSSQQSFCAMGATLWHSNTKSYNKAISTIARHAELVSASLGKTCFKKTDAKSVYLRKVPHGRNSTNNIA